MNNNTIEIELRYEILDAKQIDSFLSSAKYLHQKHDIDVYLDTPDATLWKRGVFIRIRNDKKLDFKFNRTCLQNPEIGLLDYCEEHSFSLPLEKAKLQNINMVLESLNLKTTSNADLVCLTSINNLDAHYIVDKIRTSYAYNDFTIMVDEVAGLGTFLEIEVMATNINDLENVKKNMQQTLNGLNLLPLQIGYGSLLLRKSNFDYYVQGRYVLQEDKNMLGTC